MSGQRIGFHLTLKEERKWKRSGGEGDENCEFYTRHVEREKSD